MTWNWGVRLVSDASISLFSTDFRPDVQEANSAAGGSGGLKWIGGKLHRSRLARWLSSIDSSKGYAHAETGNEIKRGACVWACKSWDWHHPLFTATFCIHVSFWRLAWLVPSHGSETVVQIINWLKGSSHDARWSWPWTLEVSENTIPLLEVKPHSTCSCGESPSHKWDAALRHLSNSNGLSEVYHPFINGGTVPYKAIFCWDIPFKGIEATFLPALSRSRNNESMDSAAAVCGTASILQGFQY